MKFVVSAGHGKHIDGAVGPKPWGLDEHVEAVKVMQGVVAALTTKGFTAIGYEETIATTQAENLRRIVDFHNSQTRDVDVSIHFNSAGETSKPLGCEVLYISQTGKEIADRVVDAICDASGLINRGPVYRPNLYFLKNTEEPAVLIEVCFVDSKADVDIYHEKFAQICGAIASSLANQSGGGLPVPDRNLFEAKGKCSWFGGPEDTGVSASEGLAFIDQVSETPHLFLPYQPSGTTGLARRLNPNVHYVACRWDYDVTSRTMLKNEVAWVRNPKTGYGMKAFPADWGPNVNTGRVADLSPGLLSDLQMTTDDQVEVTFPYRV